MRLRILCRDPQDPYIVRCGDVGHEMTRGYTVPRSNYHLKSMEVMRFGAPTSAIAGLELHTNSPFEVRSLLILYSARVQRWVLTVLGGCRRCAARFDIDLDEECRSSRLRHADLAEIATLRDG
jgi:hypothetical protein